MSMPRFQNDHSDHSIFEKSVEAFFEALRYFHDITCWYTRHSYTSESTFKYFAFVLFLVTIGRFINNKL